MYITFESVVLIILLIFVHITCFTSNTISIHFDIAVDFQTTNYNSKLILHCILLMTGYGSGVGLRITSKWAITKEKKWIHNVKKHNNHKYSTACAAIRETFSKCFKFNRPYCLECVFFRLNSAVALFRFEVGGSWLLYFVRHSMLPYCHNQNAPTFF